MPTQRMIVETGYAVFGRRAMYSKRERALRFLKEAFELARCCGLTREDIEVVAAYEWNRLAGPDIEQEFGGVGTTLYALANVHGIYLDTTIRRESMGVLDNREAIQAKNRLKPQLVRDEALV